MGRLAIIEDEGQQQPKEPSAQAAQASAEVKGRNKKQGGVSDESGYYEGDELQADDSIEIVYDRLVAKNNNDHQTNQQRLQHPAVSITPVLSTSKQGKSPEISSRK